MICMDSRKWFLHDILYKYFIFIRDIFVIYPNWGKGMANKIMYILESVIDFSSAHVLTFGFPRFERWKGLGEWCDSKNTCMLPLNRLKLSDLQNFGFLNRVSVSYFKKDNLP